MQLAGNNVVQGARRVSNAESARLAPPKTESLAFGYTRAQEDLPLCGPQKLVFEARKTSDTEQTDTGRKREREENDNVQASSQTGPTPTQALDLNFSPTVSTVQMHAHGIARCLNIMLISNARDFVQHNVVRPHTPPLTILMTASGCAEGVKIRGAERGP